MIKYETLLGKRWEKRVPGFDAVVSNVLEAVQNLLNKTNYVHPERINLEVDLENFVNTAICFVAKITNQSEDAVLELFWKEYTDCVTQKVN